MDQTSASCSNTTVHAWILSIVCLGQIEIWLSIVNAPTTGGQGTKPCAAVLISPGSEVNKARLRQCSIPRDSTEFTGMTTYPRRLMGRVRCFQQGVAARPNVAIRTSLSRSPAYGSNERKRLVPLLQPSAQQLPFGMALELWGAPQGGASPKEKQQSRDFPVGRDLYEVDYIIHGQGKLMSHDGSLDTLKPGDSVIMPYKGAWCEPLYQKGNDQDACEWGLVVLRLLLPSDLLISPNGMFSDCSVAIAACQEWFATSGESQSLTPDQVSHLLSGMQRSLRDAPPIQSKDVMLRRVVPDGSVTSATPHTLGSSVMKKSLQDLPTFQLPNQTNRLALVFDPTVEDIPFAFGVEIFEPLHHTTPHVHNSAHELFFILSGEGTAFCNGHSFAVSAGDTVVFPPGSVHGVDNGPTSKMYCLEMMLPNEMFAEFVKRGKPVGGLDKDDLCVLIAVGCS